MLIALKKTAKLLLEAFGSDSVQQLRDFHIQAGQKASGRTFEAFGSVVSDDLLLQVEGAEHVGALEYGRKAGGMTPIEVIKQWIKEKGLASAIEKENVSFAWAIAKTHQTRGSYLYRTGKTYSGFERPLSKAFDEARISKLEDDLGVSVAEIISSEVFKDLQFIKK